jgi:poly(beta-D-mannuronate) lyase
VNGGESIRIGDSQSSMLDADTTIENNFFERCNGELEIVSNKSCGNVYRRNYFDACEGTLTLRHGNRCRVDGNMFFGSESRQCGGIRIIGEDHVVVNNYLEGLRGTGFRAAISVVNGLPDSPLSGYFRVKRAYIAFNTIVRCTQPLAVGTDGGNRALVLPPEQTAVEHNVITDEPAARDRPAVGPRWWPR